MGLHRGNQAPWANPLKGKPKKEKQQRAIDREINRLIREAIAASNSRAGKKGKKTFQLTPEAKLLADNFISNKGRLPWPLEKGIVVQGFGRQRPLDISNGRIARSLSWRW